MNETREQARLLLAKAQDDAFMMRELMLNPKSPPWGIGFHAQQAVEKAIKGVLAHHGVVFPHTHDLKLLLNILSNRGILLPPHQTGILSLLPFGALLRYEPFPLDDSDEALDEAQMKKVVASVLAWAETLLGPLG